MLRIDAAKLFNAEAVDDEMKPELVAFLVAREDAAKLEEIENVDRLFAAFMKSVLSYGVDPEIFLQMTEAARWKAFRAALAQFLDQDSKSAWPTATPASPQN